MIKQDGKHFHTTKINNCITKIVSIFVVILNPFPFSKDKHTKILKAWICAYYKFVNCSLVMKPSPHSLGSGMSVDWATRQLTLLAVALTRTEIT